MSIVANAKKRSRNIPFSFLEWKRWFWQKPCVYCGQDSKGGIDRQDNNKGYDVDNCVPCCSRCNYIKGTMSVTECLGHIGRILNHSGGKQMTVCRNCGKDIPNSTEVNGKTLQLAGRKFCLECSPMGANNRRRYIVSLTDDQGYCARCSETKNLTDFHRRADGRPLSYCKECSKAVKQLKYEEKLDKLITSRSNTCIDCGQIFPTPVFQFVRDGQTFPISHAKNMSWKKLQNILEGYDMLCLNCCAMREWEK